MRRGTISKWQTKTKFSYCFCCSADARYLFTHNLLITAAFISETCECSLTSTNTKGFLFVSLESSEPGFAVRGRDNCELPRQVSRRRQCSQTPSGLIKYLNVSAVLGRKCTVRLKVNQNTRSPPLSENLNLEKRMAFSVLGSLRTVPLHSTLAVNILG